MKYFITMLGVFCLSLTISCDFTSIGHYFIQNSTKFELTIEIYSNDNIIERRINDEGVTEKKTIISADEVRPIYYFIGFGPMTSAPQPQELFNSMKISFSENNEIKELFFKLSDLSWQIENIQFLEDKYFLEITDENLNSGKL